MSAVERPPLPPAINGTEQRLDAVLGELRTVLGELSGIRGLLDRPQALPGDTVILQESEPSAKPVSRRRPVKDGGG